MDEVNVKQTHSPLTTPRANEAMDKYSPKTRTSDCLQSRESSPNPVCVELQRVSANWITGQLPPTLCNISMTIKPGELCALVGAVGSGKSSVLYLLLKELDPGAGCVMLIQNSPSNLQGNPSNGHITDNPNLRISYASQEPWLFNGTVRDNILFGQPYDRARYTQVIVKAQLRLSNLIDSNSFAFSEPSQLELKILQISHIGDERVRADKRFPTISSRRHDDSWRQGCIPVWRSKSAY